MEAEVQQNDTASQGETQPITAAQLATLAQVSAAGPTVTLVQLPNGQTVQVHGVIQASPTVIQSPQLQTVQISTIAESEDSQEFVDNVSDSQKRREILSRRPSYRKILNDLSSDSPAVPRIEEEKSEDDAPAAATATATMTVTVPTPIYQTSSGQYFAITGGGAILTSSSGSDGVQSLQPLTSQSAATILQYAHTSDGQQILVPSNQVVVQGEAYQIRASSSIAPSVVMSPALPTGTEEVTRKREVRLMKNREAARECRRKKKEYVKCLENRVAVLENQNKTLIEELKALKDLYCHKSE